MELDITVNEALDRLIKKGAQIERVSEDRFRIIDNGFWGFAAQSDPFEVNGNSIIEICEMYCK